MSLRVSHGLTACAKQLRRPLRTLTNEKIRKIFNYLIDIFY